MAFDTEFQVNDGTPLQVRTLTGAALGTNDRFQFRGTPVTTASESTGSGTGSLGHIKRPSIFDMVVLAVAAGRPA